MEWTGGRAPTALAEDLIRRGEGCAEAGELTQAATLLVRAWTLAAGDGDASETSAQAGDLSNTAAWDVAWVLVRLGAYREAASWFQRVASPPMAAGLWTVARQELVQLYAGRFDEPRDRPTSTEHVYPSPGASALPSIEVFGLGRFQIRCDGRLLTPCPSAKAMAIFRYLLTRRERAAHRDELMELFWPASAPHDAAHSLHVAISTLRRHLGPAASGVLLYQDAHYLIDPRTPIVDDCERFRQRSAEGDRARQRGDLAAARRIYEEALAHYRGDYHVSSHDLTWNVAERERLLARYLTVLDHLGAAYIADGQFEPALACYQRLLERDAYREDAHVQVMRCYAHLGRRSEGLRQFERCAGLLASELGVEPSPETRAVYEQLRAGRIPLEHRQGVASTG